MKATRAARREALATAERRGYLSAGRCETWYRVIREWELRCRAAGRPFVYVSRRGPAFSRLHVEDCDGVTEAFVAELVRPYRRFFAYSPVDDADHRGSRRGNLDASLRHEQAHAAAERLAGKGAAVDRVERARRAVEAVFCGFDEAPNAK